MRANITPRSPEENLIATKCARTTGGDVRTNRCSDEQLHASRPALMQTVRLSTGCKTYRWGSAANQDDPDPDRMMYEVYSVGLNNL